MSGRGIAVPWLDDSHVPNCEIPTINLSGFQTVVRLPSFPGDLIQNEFKDFALPPTGAAEVAQSFSVHEMLDRRPSRPAMQIRHREDFPELFGLGARKAPR